MSSSYDAIRDELINAANAYADALNDPNAAQRNAARASQAWAAARARRIEEAAIEEAAIEVLQSDTFKGPFADIDPALGDFDTALTMLYNALQKDQQ